MLLEVDTDTDTGMIMVRCDASASFTTKHRTLNIEQTIFHEPEKWLKLNVFSVYMDVCWRQQ